MQRNSLRAPVEDEQLIVKRLQLQRAGLANSGHA